MNEPRNPKGYTALINPVTGDMELTSAIIPMPGDTDYHPKNINNYIRPKDILPREPQKSMHDRRVPQPWEQFTEREPEYWQTVDISEVTRQRNAERDADFFAAELRAQDPTIPGTKAWRESRTLDRHLG